MKHELFLESQKLVLFRSYQHFCQLERVLKFFDKDIISRLELSIIGKFPKDSYENINEFEQDVFNIESKWKKLLDNSVDFGYFENSEIGLVYVVGPLTSIFLYKINEAPLGVISAGPYGILRGLGAEEKQTRAYFRLLNNGSDLLILRGEGNDLFDAENFMDSPHSQ